MPSGYGQAVGKFDTPHSGNSDKQLSLALSHHKDGQLDKASHILYGSFK